MANKERPLSPFLIYRPQITWVPSITHRITGLALGLGAVLLTWWLNAAALDAEDFRAVQSFIDSWIGRTLLLIFTFALFFHFMNGIRHLFWDFGKGFEMSNVRWSGWLVVIGSVVLTIGSWLLGYAMLGGGQ